MKSRLTLLFLVFCATNLSAQISPITLGPQVGFAHNQLITNAAQFREENKASFHAGAFVRLTIKNFILQPEAQLALNRGAIGFNYRPISNPSQTLSGTQNINLFTFDVPLLFGYQILDVKLGKLRIMGGPMASLALSNVVNVSSSGNTNDIRASDLIELRDEALWSIQMGVGADLLKFTGDIRYQYGFSDISENYSITNNLWRFTVGYKLF